MSYAAIIDVHLTNALTTYAYEDQKALLQALQSMLEEHVRTLKIALAGRNVNLTYFSG